MPVFSHDQLQDILDRAEKAFVYNLPRELLLSGLDTRYAALLYANPNMLLQMRIEVTRMNEDGWLGDPKPPLAVWLGNVKSQLAGRLNDQKFFGQYYDQAIAWGQAAMARGQAPAEAPGPARIEASVDAPPEIRLERILFKNELLPIGFLLAAAHAAQSVCRIELKLFRDGGPQMLGAGQPVLSVGSGWLIGKRHIITNHHVIGGQSDGAPPPSPEDIALQCDTAIAKFGFDADNLGRTIAVKRLCHSDELLDFAILELADEPGPEPLSLCEKDFTDMAIDPAGRFAEADRFAVNIIQHPNGASKQIAMRNNMATGIEGRNFAYFTDTDKGSSGSPVCDDRWRVVALHKAATRTQGEFDFQGKTTSWVNIGTPIVKIIDHMKNHAQPDIQALWAEIGSRMAGE